MKKVVHRRINITLPEATVALLDTVAARGSRSTFINDAITLHLKDLKKKSLQARLKEGALARAEQNQYMAEEWFHLEEELWQK